MPPGIDLQCSNHHRVQLDFLLLQFLKVWYEVHLTYDRFLMPALPLNDCTDRIATARNIRCHQYFFGHERRLIHPQ